MCVIIDKPAGLELPQKLVDIIWKNNSAGWGIMWFNQATSKVETYKALSMESFKLYTEHNTFKYTRVIYHFRKATKGEANLRNTHPLQVGKSGVWMVHNGTMSVWAIAGDSDSQVFSNMIRKPIENNPDVLKDLGFQHLLQQVIEEGIVTFMMPNGEVINIGERTWFEVDGMSLSNIRSWQYYNYLED